MAGYICARLHGTSTSYLGIDLCETQVHDLHRQLRRQRTTLHPVHASPHTVTPSTCVCVCVQVQLAKSTCVGWPVEEMLKL